MSEIFEEKKEKECPYCGELIAMAAIKCKSCKNMIDDKKVAENLNSIKPKISFFSLLSDYIYYFLSATIIKKAFVYYLRLLAILFFLGGFIVWIEHWSYLSELGAGGTFGFFFYQLLYIVAFFICAFTIWVRTNFFNFDEKSDYIIIPFFSFHVRLAGEILAILMLFLSFGTAFLYWFGLEEARFVILDLSDQLFALSWINFFIISNVEGYFFIGLLNIIMGILAAFVTLIVFRLISESMILIVDIAKNTRIISDEFLD